MDRIARITLPLAVLFVLESQSEAQALLDGHWIGPWDWTSQVHVPICGRKAEFSHAAVMPIGKYQGRVLLWKAKIAPACSPELQPTVSWIFRPGNPTELLPVQNDLPSSIFCSGMSWNWQGHLIVTGGASIQTGGGIPAETWRFNPTMLDLPSYPVGCNPCMPIVEGNPWFFEDAMSIARYYPSLIPLDRRTQASSCDLVEGGGTAPVIQGGGQLVLGGPPGLAGGSGNELFQIFEPVTNAWSHTLAPEAGGHNPDTLPFLSVSTPAEIYTLEPTPPEVQPKLDTYPRAFQLGESNLVTPTVNGAIFVANDVDTQQFPYQFGPPTPTGLPPNSPGRSWALKPPTATPTGCWELWQGQPEPLEANDTTKDRYYGTAVILHTLDVKNRVLVFGGSQDPAFPSPCSNLQDWTVHDAVYEHQPQGQNPAVDGTWHSKAPLEQARVFLNAVTLPTGHISDRRRHGHRQPQAALLGLDSSRGQRGVRTRQRPGQRPPAPLPTRAL